MEPKQKPEINDPGPAQQPDGAKYFVVDPRVILHLGRDSIRDHTTAVVELVKNAYDADATRVDIEILSQSDSPYQQFIRVRDNGSGMSEDDVDKKWLRIGYSEKRRQKISPILGRRTTGEKGIGRISADRLGAKLELVTHSESSAATFGLEVDWSQFEASTTAIHQIPLPKTTSPTFHHVEAEKKWAHLKFPKWIYRSQGTELTIRELRHKWTGDDIIRLRSELAIFGSPFAEIADFEISLYTDCGPEFCGQILSSVPEQAAVELRAEYDGKGTIKYSVSGNLIEEEPDWIATPLDQLSQAPTSGRRAGSSSQTKTKTDAIQRTLGPASITLFFYLQTPEAAGAAGISLTTLRDYLQNNAGVRIYRDGIWVKPYGVPGDPNADWLQLGRRKTSNPAGAGRDEFKISPGQLLGGIFLTRDANPEIYDSAGREGLIHSDAFEELRQLATGCLQLLETKYHEIFVKRKAAQAKTSISKASSLASRLTELKENLIRQIRPIATDPETVDLAIQSIDDTAAAIESLASQNTILRGLATTGIAASVFGHETQSSIAQTLGALSAAQALLEDNPPLVKEAIEEVDKASTFSNRVASWGTFALYRVQRDKRRKRKLDIKKLIESLIKEFVPALQGANIEIKQKLDDVQAKIFAMDVEAVVVNLVTNAYSACSQSSRKRQIHIKLASKKQSGRDGFLITVSDSGPGVAKQFLERIWEPLFTTKTATDGKFVGTGLGLSVVQSILDEAGGSREVDSDPDLKGARFRIWLPSELK